MATPFHRVVRQLRIDEAHRQAEAHVMAIFGPCARCGATALRRDPIHEGTMLWYACMGCGIARHEGKIDDG